jgi:hypothetical protein
MGFDIFGIKPHNPQHLVKPELDYSKDPTDEQKEEYFNRMEHYERNVPGYYFRNNVWWWRPLWTYVCTYTDVLTSEQQDEGGSNSGAEVDEEQAIELATQLHKLIDSGHTAEHEQAHMREYELAQIRNNELEEARKILHEVVIAETGDASIVPANYPESFKDDWDNLWAQKQWAGSYPFSTDNIKEFANFCYGSGGFQIW